MTRRRSETLVMMRYDLHDDVMQVLGPGGQVPAAAAGPARGVWSRHEDVWIQCPGIPRQYWCYHVESSA